jgi:hypothetical protein
MEFFVEYKDSLVQAGQTQSHKAGCAHLARLSPCHGDDKRARRVELFG